MRILLFLCLLPLSTYSQSNFILPKLDIGGSSYFEHLYAKLALSYPNCLFLTNDRKGDIDKIKQRGLTAPIDTGVGADYVINFTEIDYAAEIRENKKNSTTLNGEQKPTEPAYSFNVVNSLGVKMSISKVKDGTVVLNEKIAVYYSNRNNPMRQTPVISKQAAVQASKDILFERLHRKIVSMVRPIILGEISILEYDLEDKNAINRLIINGGHNEGLKEGDKLTVYEKVIETIEGKYYDRLVELGELKIKKLGKEISYCKVKKGDQTILQALENKKKIAIRPLIEEE